jgi:predicted nucleic acid-binding protein
LYLLDTNVVSELRKVRPHGAVVAWLEGVRDVDLHLSAVTLGEIQAGVEITREQDAAKAAEIEAWLELVAGTWNVLAADGAVFRAWARLMHARDDRLIEDALIAATALVHGLTVVTRNVKDFRPLGVTVLDPFAAR